MAEPTAPAALGQLERELAGLLDRDATAAGLQPRDDVFTRVNDRLVARGFHALSDHAAPWRDLLLWKHQEERAFTVQLTDTQREVHVVFMKEFYSQGWTHFASLGRVTTSGWAAADRLYCVDWAYDRDSESFRISYLKHETRHLVDYERFPQLQQADLEYRAKLTELAFASATLPRVLAQFRRDAAPNPALPHAFANLRVTRDLHALLYDKPLPASGEPWAHLSPVRVNRAARELLRRHTRALTRAD